MIEPARSVKLRKLSHLGKFSLLAAASDRTHRNPRMTKRSLPLLSNSSLNTFRRCPREYYFRYVLLRKTRSKSAALRFGTLFHVALNAWWRCNGSELQKLQEALTAIDAESGEHDPFEVAKARCLIIGYTARWGEEGYETIAVELQFRLPLEIGQQVLDSVTGIVVGHTSPGRVYDLGGAIDAIARKNVRGNARLCIVEHKTTSADISVGADYWRHIVTMDPQVSTYMSAAKSLGYNPHDTLYDVIRKPDIRPLVATPEEERKWTKPTKAEPIPRLYKNQRETDETPEEFEARLLEDIEENPGRYFARMPIVRLEEDDEAHRWDVIDTARMIQFAESERAWPRSPNACERFRRLCGYHDACSGITTIEDDSRFETKTHQHEELKQ